MVGDIPENIPQDTRKKTFLLFLSYVFTICETGDIDVLNTTINWRFYGEKHDYCKYFSNLFNNFNLNKDLFFAGYNQK